MIDWTRCPHVKDCGKCVGLLGMPPGWSTRLVFFSIQHFFAITSRPSNVKQSNFEYKHIEHKLEHKYITFSKNVQEIPVGIT